jgi:hypothetical protein
LPVSWRPAELLAEVKHRLLHHFREWHVEAHGPVLREHRTRVAVADERTETLRDGVLVAVEAQLPVHRRKRIADRSPEIERRAAKRKRPRRNVRNGRLVDDHRDRACALSRLAGISERVQRHIRSDDERCLTRTGAGPFPLECLA